MPALVFQTIDAIILGSMFRCDMPTASACFTSALLFLTPLMWLIASASEPKTTGPIQDKRPRIVAFGDSLTSGLGVAAEDAYPAQLQRRLDATGFRYRVINAGVSGDTTAGGLRRVNWILNSRPSIVILELGGNDGLRGLSLEETKHNLERIIEQLQKASVAVVVAGMKLPPNYGTEYTKAFEAIYPGVAKQYGLKLIPFFLDGIAGSAKYNQADGIHPTAEGYRIIVEKLLSQVTPLLKR